MELGGHAPFIVLRRRRPGARGQGAAAGEVPQHRSGVHLPQPHVRAARHRRRSSSPPWSSGSSALKAGNGLDDGVTVGPLIDDAALAKMERQVADAVDKGATARDRWRAAHRRRPRRRLVLRADAARRRHARHAHLPRGDVRPGRAGHRLRRRGRGDRDGQRHRLRARVVRLHEQPVAARSGSWSGCSSAWWASTTSTRRSAAAPFGGVKQSGLGVEGAREGIDEYLDTKLVGITL